MLTFCSPYRRICSNAIVGIDLRAHPARAYWNPQTYLTSAYLSRYKDRRFAGCREFPCPFRSSTIQKSNTDGQIYHTKKRELDVAILFRLKVYGAADT